MHGFIHRSQKFRRVLCAVFLLAATLPAPALAASTLPKCVDEGKWLRFEGEHFVLITNAEAAEAAEHARQLDRFARVFYMREPGMQQPGAERVVAFGLAGKGCFNPFRPVYGGKPVDVVGTYFAGPLGSYLQFLVSGSPEDLRVIRHEYMHALSSDQLRGAPPCLSEGLADFYSTLEFHGNEARFGHPLKPFVWFLGQTDLMSMDELFGTGYGSEYYQGTRRDLFYAESWALAHALISDGQRDKILDFVAAVREGAAPQPAFTQAFAGESWSGMPAKLKQHVAADDLGYFVLPIGATVLEGPIEQRAATPIEVRVGLGDLLLQQGRTGTDEAPAYYLAALATDPADGRALTGLGGVNQRRGAVDLALQCYRRAEVDRDNDATTWRRLGEGYLAIAFKDSTAFAERTDSVRTLIRSANACARHALVAEPRSRSAALFLARTVDGDSAAARAALVPLRAAQAALPRDKEIADALAGTLLEVGEVDEAEAVLLAAYGRSSRPGSASPLARQVDYARMKSIEAMLRAGKTEEATVAMNDLLQTTSDPELARHLKAQLERVDVIKAANRDVDRFNEGANLVRAGKLTEALKIFDALGADAEDPGLLLEARKRAEQIREFQKQQRAAGR